MKISRKEYQCQLSNVRHHWHLTVEIRLKFIKSFIKTVTLTEAEWTEFLYGTEGFPISRLACFPMSVYYQKSSLTAWIWGECDWKCLNWLWSIPGDQRCDVWMQYRTTDHEPLTSLPTAKQPFIPFIAAVLAHTTNWWTLVVWEVTLKRPPTFLGQSNSGLSALKAKHTAVIEKTSINSTLLKCEWKPSLVTER